MIAAQSQKKALLSVVPIERCKMKLKKIKFVIFGVFLFAFSHSSIGQESLPGSGGGGCGANAAGSAATASVPGAGGNGIASSITGSSVTRGGGGGGGGRSGV